MTDKKEPTIEFGYTEDMTGYTVTLTSYASSKTGVFCDFYSQLCEALRSRVKTMTDAEVAAVRAYAKALMDDEYWW